MPLLPDAFLVVMMPSALAVATLWLAFLIVKL